MRPRSKILPFSGPRPSEPGYDPKFMRTLTASPFALLLLATPALATTYQVGSTRTLKTLGAVASQLGPGDVVEVDGNTTYTGGIVLSKAGAKGNPITVRGVAVNGKRPLLSGGTNTIEIQGDHYVIQGFEVTGGTSRCVYHHADDVTMRDLVVHDCKAQGLLGADQDSGSLTLEYSEFYGSGSGTQDHQIYMATDEVAHPGSVFRMQFCYVHDGAGGNNVKSRAQRNEIYYNWIEGAVYHELELIGPDPGGAPAGWTEGLAREDSDVVGNVLRKTQTSFVVRFGGDGTGQSNGRYRFVANTVLTQPGGSAVFRLFDGIESVEMHDNLFFVDPNPAGASNIVRDTEAVWSTGSRIVGGSHNWVLNHATNVPAEWTTTVEGTNPGLASISTMDLRPISTSPLADACTCISSPTGHDFPSPLAWPEFEPPVHLLEAPGGGVPRSVSGQLYIGAFQSSGSGGTTGTGGAAASGGSAGAGGATGNGGATSAGGTTSSGGAVNAGGARSGGGATSSGGAATAGDGGTVAGGGATSAAGASAAGTTGAAGLPVNGSGGSNGSGAASTGAGGSVLGGPSGGATQAGSAGEGANAATDTSSGDSGCTCRIETTGGATPQGSQAKLVAVVSLLWFAHKRRRTRSSS